MKDSKIDMRRRGNINAANGSRLSAPLALYPYQRMRESSLVEEDNSRLPMPHRSVASLVNGTPSSTRKTFKNYTISEILKTKEDSPERENFDGSRNHHQLSIGRQCYASKRESAESCWCYEDGIAGQHCNSCCQCYSSYRYPYTMPYRAWQVAGDRDTLHYGFASPGMPRSTLLVLSFSTIAIISFFLSKPSNILCRSYHTYYVNFHWHESKVIRKILEYKLFSCISFSRILEVYLVLPSSKLICFLCQYKLRI